MFSILFISASACSCVLWHGGFYILCLLFVIVCLLVAVLNMETKQNLLNICLCMYLWRVYVENGKNASLKNERSNKSGKTSNAKYYIIFCICVLWAVHSIVVLLSTNVTLSLSLRVCYTKDVCLCGFYVLSLFVSAYIYILWSVCVC